MAYDIFTGEKARGIYIPEIDTFLTVEKTAGNREIEENHNTKLVADCRGIYHLSLA